MTQKKLDRISRRYNITHKVIVNGFDLAYEWDGSVFDCIKVGKV